MLAAESTLSPFQAEPTHIPNRSQAAPSARRLSQRLVPQPVHPARLIESFHHPKAEGSSHDRIQNTLAIRRQAEPNTGIVVAGRNKVFADLPDRLHFPGGDVE